MLQVVIAPNAIEYNKIIVRAGECFRSSFTRNYAKVCIVKQETVPADCSRKRKASKIETSFFFFILA